MNKLIEKIRLASTANAIHALSTEEGQNKVFESFKEIPDDKLNVLGLYSGIKEKHLSIFRSILRNEENEFTHSLAKFDYKLTTGDIILVTGKSSAAKALVISQKTFYLKARSSHVVVVHADHLCIDAMPKDGVSLRDISEVMDDVEDDWRVIRFKELTEDCEEKIMKSCVFYLRQPYKILPKRKPAKRYSYCSELARKVFIDSSVANTNIPNVRIIKPCDFDKLADKDDKWIDVTDSVKPYIDFCIEYEDILNYLSRSVINGLNLNRSRYEERKDVRKEICKYEAKGLISSATTSKFFEEVKKIEAGLNFKFWDTNK